MDVDMEIDEVNLSEDQKNIIQNMSSLFPKEVTANFFNVLRNSLPGNKTPRKQSTLDGWLRKSTSPKTTETPSSVKQKNLPSTSRRSSEESNNKDSGSQCLQNESVGLGNSNNALQNDSSNSIKESVELDSEKIIMKTPTDEELVKKMFTKSLMVELKRVEIGNPNVKEMLAGMTPSEKVLNRDKNTLKQIISDTNRPLNEMSTNDSGFGQDMQSPDLCEKVDILDVDSLSSPKSKAKRLHIRKESSFLDKKTSGVELCQDSSDFNEKFDNLDVDSLPSPKKKTKRCDKKESSSVCKKGGIESSDARPGISDKTENKDSASLVENVNNDNSSPGHSSTDSLPSPKKKTKGHYNKKELSFVNRKDTIEISGSSPAISDKTENKDCASMVEKVNNDNSSPVQSSADSLPSPKKRTKQQCKKESSSVKRKDGIESSDASTAISNKTEKGCASVVGNVNNDNSSPVQSSADSLPSPKKKTKQQYGKKESSSIKRKDEIESSDASTAISDKSEKDCASLVRRNVNNDNSSPVQSSADSLPSPKKKTKGLNDKKESSSVNRRDSIENPDASPATSHETERGNCGPLVGIANDSNSSLGQFSAVPTKTCIRTRQTSQRLSLENKLTCSLSNDADEPHFTAKERDEADIMESQENSSRPTYKTTSTRLRMKLNDGVDSDNKGTEKNPSSFLDQPKTVAKQRAKRSRTLSKENAKTVVVKQREKRSRTLSKEIASSSNPIRQDSSPIGSETKLKNGVDSNNKSTGSDETSLIETVIKKTGKRSRTLSKETVADSSPIKRKRNDVLESKSSSKISKTNKKSNQLSEMPNEQPISAEGLDHLRKVVQHLNELVEATEESNDELSDVVNENAPDKTNTICGNSKRPQVKSKALLQSRKLAVRKKSNKKLETYNNQKDLTDEANETAEIGEVNNSAAEQMTKSKLDANTSKKTKITKNADKNSTVNKKLNDVQQTTDTTCRESEIRAPGQLITLVKEECISEDAAGLSNPPEIEENGNVDSSESNKLAVKVQSIIRTIKATTKTNQRKAKNRKTPRNSKLVDEQPQIDDSAPNEALSGLNQPRTVGNETIPELVNPPAAEKSTSSSITVEDELCVEGSSTTSASAENQKNFEQFCKLKEVCFSLNISMEQLFHNRKLTKQLKSPCKSDAYAFISGHKLKNGQTLPSVFKIDSKEQFKNILQSYAAKS